MRSRSLLVCLSLVLSLRMGVLAQELAVCRPGWEWNRNSLGQDPCTIMSKLDAGCRGWIVYEYLTLNSTQSYYPPSGDHPGDLKCDCNSVMFSLLMACTMCEGAVAYSWTKWIAACETVYISQYPADIPQGTTVPHWAFFNVTTLSDGMFDNNVAYSIGRDPEAKPKQLNTATAPPPVVTSPIKGNSSHTGAIAGGVVGGVIAFIIIGIVVFFALRRSRKNRDEGPQPEYQHQGGSVNSRKSPLASPTSDLDTPIEVQNAQLRPYNPEDPSTFPPPMGQQPVTYVTPTSNYGSGR